MFLAIPKQLQLGLLITFLNRMSQDSTPSIKLLPHGGYVSTAFVFGSVANQASANSAYVAKSTIDASNAADPTKKDRVYTFKSDYERMQYLLGKIATVPRCAGSGHG